MDGSACGKSRFGCGLGLHHRVISAKRAAVSHLPGMPLEDTDLAAVFWDLVERFFVGCRAVLAANHHLPCAAGGFGYRGEPVSCRRRQARLQALGILVSMRAHRAVLARSVPWSL